MRWILLILLLAGCSDDSSVSVGNNQNNGPNNPQNNTQGASNNELDMNQPGDMTMDDMSNNDAGACTASQTACETPQGTLCCDAETACLFDSCVPLGDACSESQPCPPTQFCEPSVDRCVDIDANPNACVYIPPVGEFSPVEAWSWTESVDSPEYDQVMMMPAVANLTDDNSDGTVDTQDIPDVVFVTFRSNRYNDDGVLRVISGLDGAEHWSSSTLGVPFYTAGGTIPALGDIDLDGVPEIIVSAGPTNVGLYAIKANGEILWHQPGVPNLGSQGPSIANIDQQGPPEIITPNRVVGSDGRLICSLPTSAGIPVVADVNLDGVMEILHGASLYQVTNIDATDGTGCTLIQDVAVAGGYLALANFDADPNPEIVQVVGGNINLLEHDGTPIWSFEIPLDVQRVTDLYGITDCAPEVPTAGQACTTHAECGPPLGQCASNRCRKHTACNRGGGAPTVADFDGDGLADIAVAARWYYLVLTGAGEVLWAHATKDFSSAVTGSSVFDFEGDGKAEVVYNDELFLRVYSGAGTGTDADGNGYNDPEILVEIPNSSGTLLEYPLIVDVDNDGNAEIVVAANNYSTAGSTTKGIRVFKDASDNWVGTRRIWNQHAYHVTNIDEDGSVPDVQVLNWTAPGLNNFRQNVQGDGLFNAPNFEIEISEVVASTCVQTGVVIRFQLKNTGSIGVRAGTVPVSVYITLNGQETLIETVTNTQNLGPGAEENFEIVWAAPSSAANKNFDVRVVADDDGAGGQSHNECHEDDNTALEPDNLCQLLQ